VNEDGRAEYAPAFGKSLDYDGGEYGIAALVRGTIVRATTEALPVQPPQERSGKSYEPRAALVVETSTRLGTLQLLNTHLDASRAEDYRLQESAHVLAIVNRMDTAEGLMAGGDFNAEPGSRTHLQFLFAGLQDAWLRCGEGDGFTFPADKPIKRIDYLFLAPGLRCTNAQVLDTRVSDHRPLLVTVTK
jgi:endonuclease/exonuclease/phosphatase family metal-dependent hydrolase